MDEKDVTMLQGAVAFLAGAWLTLLSWLGKRQLNDTAANTKALGKKVDRDEYNGTIESLRTRIDDNSRKLETKITAGNNRIYDQMKADAKEQRARDEKMISAIYSKKAGK